ncbi:putative zinc ribbon protein [Citrobacter koseri]
MTRPVKPVQPVTPIQPLGPRVLRIKTTQRKWHCVWCGHQYYGTKQCPQCREWTYTLEDSDSF